MSEALCKGVIIFLDDGFETVRQQGMFKVMAKIGISTLQSYKGAQIFEALGLADPAAPLAIASTVALGRAGGRARFAVSVGVRPSDAAMRAVRRNGVGG